MPVAKKTTTKAPQMTAKEKAYIRLKCLSMVVEHGNNINRSSPSEKANEYYEFVMNGYNVGRQKAETVSAPRLVPVEAIATETIVPDVPEESNPFQSERNQVFIS